MNFKTLTLMGTVLCALSSQTAEAKFEPKIYQTKSGPSKKLSTAELIEYAKKQSQQKLSIKKATNLSTAKTTATKSRLVAYAYRDLSIPMPNDTAKLYYGSTNRGSDIPNQVMQHDSMLAFTYDMSTSAFVKDYYEVQTFDALDNVLTSTEKYWDDAAMMYVNDYRTTNTYNSSNKIVSTISESWDGSTWVNDSKNVIKYDAAQNKLVDSSFEWVAGAWEPYFVETNTYTVTNKLASSSYHIYESTLAMWLNIATLSNTYDASDYLTSSLLKVISMTTFTLEDNSRITFTNDASGNPIVSLQERWDDILGTWVNDTRNYSTFDAAKNKTSEIYTMWNDLAGKFDTLSLLNNSYNSYNQIQTEVNSNWDMSAGTWNKSDSTTYYYEEHTPTSIIEIVKNSNSKVYPVPATNELTVSANIGEAQKIQLNVADIQGRVLIQINQNSSADFNQKISVSNIPSGNYVLSITGDKGFKSVQKISVVH